MASPELSLAAGALPVGLHMNVNKDKVSIACTPEQRQRMLDRIAKAWQAFGNDDPHWSVLTHDQYRRGSIDDRIDGFYATGTSTVGQIVALLSRNGLTPADFPRVLDFGCGVGRLSLALAAQFDRVVGVDVSPPHLTLAREQAHARSVANTEFIHVQSIEGLADLPLCDLLFSLIVLQHNPPPVIAATIEGLLRLVAPGGAAVFQVPTYIAGFSFDAATYLASDQEQMEMNPLPQRHVFAIAARAGFVPLEVREDLSTGSANIVSQTFLFKRPG